MAAEEGVVQHQASDREMKLREILVPEIYKLCEYLDKSGLDKVERKHGVSSYKTFTLELGNALVDIRVTFNVGRA